MSGELSTLRAAGGPETGGNRSGVPAAADQALPTWLTVLFWICVLQLPFELPLSVIPIPGMVVTHLEVTLLLVIVGYLIWRVRGVGLPRLRSGGWFFRAQPEAPSGGRVGRARGWRHAGLQPQTWVLVWLGTLVLSAALAPSLHSVSIRFVLRSTAIASLFWVSRDTHRCGRSVAGLLAGLAATVAIVGLLEGGLNPRIESVLQPFRSRPSFLDGIWRLTSTFSHANQTATWLGMSLPIVIALGLERSSPGAGRARAAARFTAWATLFGVLLWALLSTLGRGGIIAGLLVTTAILGLGASHPRTRRYAAGLLIVLAGVVGVRLGISPELRSRFKVADPGPAFSAAYGCPAKLTVVAGSRQSIHLRLTNTGFASWSARGAFPVHLSYHLYDLAHLDRTSVEGVRTELPATMRRDASVAIEANLVAPPDSGLHLVAWDLVRERLLWFSGHQVEPGMTLLRVLPAGAVAPMTPDPQFEAWHADMDRQQRIAWYAQLAKRLALQFAPRSAGANGGIPQLDPEKIPRRVLWKAAFELFRERPLTGWGPDTYRFLYSRRIGLSPPNTNLQAHDLYLELLATGGLICLAAWMAFLGALLVRLLPASRARPLPPALLWGWAGTVIVFCLHGLVDSFFGSYELMGLFWVSAGALAAGLESLPPRTTAAGDSAEAT